jgi:hypothetical protein
MGVCFRISCRDCKVTRDLDKMPILDVPANTRAEALALSEKIGMPGFAFRSTLLWKFLWDHMGHNLAFWNDTDDKAETEMDPDSGSGYLADGNHFWDAFSDF